MTKKANRSTMKTKVMILSAFLMLAVGSNAIAQEKCATLGSLFIEPAKAKNYDGALPHYDKLVNECPTYSMATYQYAEKMFKHFIENGDKSKISDLDKAYKLRLQYYPTKTKEGELMMKMAQVKFDNGMGTKMEQFDSFDAAFKKDEDEFTSPKSLYTYFSLAVDLFNAGEKPIDDVMHYRSCLMAFGSW